MKKIMISIMALTLISGLITAAFAIDATPTASTVLVDGTEVKVNAYNIDGNNYFKLRDVAYMLNGTSKQFEVGYDGELNSIVLTSNQSYTVMGGEMEQGGNEVTETSVTSSKIIKDGVETEMLAYNIDGNNYFKLRDLGEKFNFGVDYDEKTNSVSVDTDKGYGDSDEELNDTNSNKYQGDFLKPRVKPTPMPPVTVPAP
ncbi:MAG: stalk domain-containing protein [Hominilimicola sp.]